MDLIARKAELTAIGMQYVPTHGTSFLGSELIRDRGHLRTQMALVPTIDELVLDMVLMGVELPKIYRKERNDGSFEIIENRCIPETILAVLESEEAKTDPDLYNLFWNVNMQFVTFMPIVKLAHAERLTGF